jgi:hypothetical protein
MSLVSILYRASNFYCMAIALELSSPSGPPSAHNHHQYSHHRCQRHSCQCRRCGTVVRAPKMMTRLRHDNDGLWVQLRGILGLPQGKDDGEVFVADGQSEDDDPRGCDCHVTEAVNTLDCGNGRGIAGAAMTIMTRE